MIGWRTRMRQHNVCHRASICDWVRSKRLAIIHLIQPIASLEIETLRLLSWLKPIIWEDQVRLKECISSLPLGLPLPTRSHLILLSIRKGTLFPNVAWMISNRLPFLLSCFRKQPSLIFPTQWKCSTRFLEALLAPRLTRCQMPRFEKSRRLPRE